jgi:hypothetical protein
MRTTVIAALGLLFLLALAAGCSARNGAAPEQRGEFPGNFKALVSRHVVDTLGPRNVGRNIIVRPPQEAERQGVAGWAGHVRVSVLEEGALARRDYCYFIRDGEVTALEPTAGAGWCAP